MRHCLTTFTIIDENGDEHISCLCVKEKIAGLEAENAKLRDALRYIAESMRWGEDTAIKRTITDLQNTALDALETTNG